MAVNKIKVKININAQGYVAPNLIEYNLLSVAERCILFFLNVISDKIIAWIHVFSGSLTVLHNIVLFSNDSLLRKRQKAFL